MKVEKVLVLLPLNDKQKESLEERFTNIKFIYNKADNVDEESIKSVEVIIGNPKTDYLKYAENLKWIQLNSAGADKYIKEGVLNPKIALTNATGAYGLAISEHMMGLLLNIFKKLNKYLENQKNHIWNDEGVVRTIYGSKILIVGLGNIGEEFAKRAKAFGAYVIGVRHSNRGKPEFIDEIYLIDDIEELLPQADVVVLTLPNTKETYKMFDSHKLKLMKKGSVLLNAGRGTVLDTDALCDEIENGHLLGAGLDVVDPEPLPQEHRIWDIENIIITPHVSGGYHIKETLENILNISMDNLSRFINGDELKNVIDFSTGYAKNKK